jgi:hypothetical protein
MSKKADAEKQQQEHAAAAMDTIEAAACKQYEADQAAAQAQAGKWVWHEGSGYYYNATHRWVVSVKHQVHLSCAAALKPSKKAMRETLPQCDTQVG